MPYPDRPSQGYQHTKIEAERRVLAAATRRISGPAAYGRVTYTGGAGDDLFFLKDVAVCFGTSRCPRLGCNRAAPMPMVHVENIAAAHLVAAGRHGRDRMCLRQWGIHCRARGALGNAVHGQAFCISDFNQNVVCLYHEAGGTAPPRVKGLMISNAFCTFCGSVPAD